MTKQRRQRSDSGEAAIKAAKNAALPDHEPPASYPLKDYEMPFFTDILHARSRDDWRDVDLHLAAQLARCMSDIQRQESRLQDEEVVIVSAIGKMEENPRIKVIARYKTMQGAIMRTLQLGGRIAIDPRNMQKAADLEKQARALRGEIVEDEEPSLIPE
jgi:hypothetical protein